MNKIKQGHHEKYFSPPWEVDRERHLQFVKTALGISEKHRFISVLIPKNAGTSIRRGILEKNVDDYIISPDLPEPIDNIKWLPFFRFTFVRNPYERFVSAYTYFIETGHLDTSVTFKKFAMEKAWDGEGNAANCHWLQQHFYVGNWVNFIGRMEDFEADLKTVLDRIGLNCQIPCMNKSNHSNYRDYYDKDSRTQITKKYEEDLDLFRYIF